MDKEELCKLCLKKDYKDNICYLLCVLPIVYEHKILWNENYYIMFLDKYKNGSK